MKKAPKILLWCLGSVAGLLALVILVLQIVFATNVSTRLVNKYSDRFIDGNLSFGKVDLSLFKHFPNLTVSLEDCSLTYPHERFDAFEDGSRRMNRGRQEEADTLASFRRFVASASLPELISGNIDLPFVWLDAPRIFAKSYNDSTANWNIFKFAASEEDDDSTGTIPPLSVGKLRLTDRPDISFCAPQDSLFLSLRLERLLFKGLFRLDEPLASHGRFAIDTLRANGRIGADTLSFRLGTLRLRGDRDGLDISADARASARTRNYGRIRVPVELGAMLSLPEDSIFTVDLRRLTLNVGGIPLEASGTVGFAGPDSLLLAAKAGIYGCDLSSILSEYAVKFWDGANDFKTDAVLDVDVRADGLLCASNGVLPSLSACVKLPDCFVDYAPLGRRVNADIDIDAYTDKSGKIIVDMDKVRLCSDGISIDLDGDLQDLLGPDPAAAVKADLSARVEDVMAFLPDSLGIEAGGRMHAVVDAAAHLSQLNMAHIADADINASVDIDTIRFAMPADSISALVRTFKLTAATTGAKREGKSISKDERLLTVKVTADSLGADVAGMFAQVKGLDVKAMNTASILDGDSKGKVHPFRGTVFAESLHLRDADSLSLRVRNTRESFAISPYNGDRSIPVLSLRSTTERAFVRSGVNRASVRDLSLKLSATMNTRSRNGGPASSHGFRQRAAERPDWLSDETLRSGDLNFSLGDELAKYFREWNLDGTLSASSARVMTPYFPLRTSLTALSARFDNNTIALEEFGLKSGDSDLAVTATVTGLRRMLLGRGVLHADAVISSESMDANQLLTAYSQGSQFKPSSSAMAEDDAAYEAQIAAAAAKTSADSVALVIVPANLIADIKLDAHNVKYASLTIDTLALTALAQERCLQISDFKALSSAGNIYLDAFYATKTRKDVSCGFSLRLQDMSAEQIIDVIPSVDEALPMLKCFSGLLNCNVSATSSLDEHMNFLMPTMDGVLRITGTDLTIENSPDFTKIARLLLFKDNKKATIQTLEVDGMLKNSRVEVFPFIVDVDRYTLALSGVQNMAGSNFRYHASILHSPQPLRFGVDLYGTSAKTKFSLGKVKYQDASSVPVFTDVVEESSINLLESIRNIFQKGVDTAVKENREQREITSFKRNRNYVNAAEAPSEALDAATAAEIEAQAAAAE